MPNLHPRCEAILKLRARLQLTQRELAAQIGTTVTQISRWEHGTVPGEAWWRIICQKWPGTEKNCQTEKTA